MSNKNITKNMLFACTSTSHVQFYDFIPNCSTSSQFQTAQKGWGLWSFQNTWSLPLLPPYTFPLLHHGSFPWAAVLLKQTALSWVPTSHHSFQKASCCMNTSTCSSWSSLQAAVEFFTGHRGTGYFTMVSSVDYIIVSNFPHLGSAGLFVSLLSHSCCAALILPCPKYAITEVQLLGISFGGHWVHFGASWNWLCPKWGEPPVSSERGHL